MNKPKTDKYRHPILHCKLDYFENMGLSLRGRTLINKPRIISFLILSIIVSSNISVVYADTIVDQFIFTLDSDFDTVDVDLKIFRNRSVLVTVTFNESADSGETQVWPIITYHGLTKTVIENEVRYVDIHFVRFNFGWMNTTRSILVLGYEFAVRIFYDGSEPASVNVTIESEPGALVSSPEDDNEFPIGLMLISTSSCIALVTIVFLKKRKFRDK